MTDGAMRSGLRTLLSAGGLGLLSDCQLEELTHATAGERARRKDAAARAELEILIGKKLTDLWCQRRQAAARPGKYYTLWSIRVQGGRRRHTVGFIWPRDGKVVIQTGCRRHEIVLEPAEAAARLSGGLRKELRASRRIPADACGHCYGP